MQLIEAGGQHLVLLELEPEMLRKGAAECGFSCEIEDLARATVLELEAPDRDAPLMLFDAADPANTPWFSRCQFYIDARTGGVLQTPFFIANHLDAGGRPKARALRLQIRKEIPSAFRLPGAQPVNEKVLYGVLFNFLAALTKNGVAVCGSGVVKPLSRR